MAVDMGTRWRATVTGNTEFPLDMLRYDACYPATSMDVVILKESIEYDLADGPYTVVLNGGILYQLGPNKARWESFGWTVKEWTWI
jgi:hypothetical protein